MSSLVHAIENEIRPGIARLGTEQERLRTDQRGLERRLNSVEDLARSVIQALEEAKNEVGRTLSILIGKVEKVEEAKNSNGKVLAAIMQKLGVEK